jgi:hypothetical protein
MAVEGIAVELYDAHVTRRGRRGRGIDSVAHVAGSGIKQGEHNAAAISRRLRRVAAVAVWPRWRLSVPLCPDATDLLSWPVGQIIINHIHITLI